MSASSSIGQRFTQLIQQLGLSKNAFAMSLDKTATVIQHLVDERNKPGYDLICKVFEIYPNVSKDWLLLGQGPMLLSGPTPPPPAAAEVVAPAIPAPVPAAKVVAGAPAESLPLPPIAPPAPVLLSLPEAVAAPLIIAPPLAAAAPAAVQSPPASAAALLPLAPATPAAPDAAYLTVALQTQYLQHQLALAEQRNQHLLAQQALMQQMLDLLQR